VFRATWTQPTFVIISLHAGMRVDLVTIGSGPSGERDNWIRTGWPSMVGWGLGLMAAAALYFALYQGVPERDFFQLLPSFSGGLYTVYAGTAGGTYRRLAQNLEDGNDEYHGFVVKTFATSGTLDNSVNIATALQSIAFMAEPMLSPPYQPVGTVARAITALYLQHAFIAYNKTNWAAYKAANCKTTSVSAPIEEQLRVTDDDNPEGWCSRRYLGGAVWDAGPTGSGARLVVNQILQAANLRPQMSSSKSIEDQAKQLTAAPTRIQFCFSGTDNAVFDAVKQNPAELAVAGIPPLYSNRPQAMALRPTAFANPGDASSNPEQLETLGAYAWLIASPDVPVEHLQQLVARSAGFVSRMNHTNPTTSHLIGVASTLKSQAQARHLQLWFLLVQFLSTAFGLTMFGGYICSSWASRRDRAAIMKEHSRLRLEVLRKRFLLHCGTSMLEELCVVAKALDESVVRIHHDAQRGRLSMGHRDQLLSSAASVSAEVKRQCAFQVRAVKSPASPPELQLIESLIKYGCLECDAVARLQSPGLTPKCLSPEGV
jgi:TRAP-type uncharacterized transport system substrate-binding protein